ncbi:(Fe-S)-binding protein [Kibdelosporangium lantanae]
MTGLILGVACVLLTVVAVVLTTRTVRRMIKTIRLGQPDPTRNGPFGRRFATMLKEVLGHTRMLKWSHVGVAHWFVMAGFGGLILSVVAAYGEVFDPAFELPVLDSWSLYNLFVEVLGVTTVLGILALILIRQRNHPRRADRQSRFAGSRQGRAYFVEAIVLVEGLGVMGIRASKYAAGHFDAPVWAAPVTHLIGSVLPASGVLVSVFAAMKIFSAMIWLIVISMNQTMGVAWHRFTAFFNIYFKRNEGVALGALKPMMSGGKLLDFEEADPETDVFGAGKVEDFSWKGWLDFTTCTECGRCQSQCPAWNTGKPLSPKMVITQLRDHAYAKAPYLLDNSHADVDVLGMALVGDVIDPEVLWSCTTCGACVEQCPVDIEHVDHIVDMRRYQVLIESSFPSELNGMFKNLENKGNPWGQNAKDRLAWTEGLDFEVPVFDGSQDFEYLFWVGCAGAFEDRAKKTTRAVAELLHIAGVKYAVLGSEEACTGDPARRAGNEFLFQMLAQQNVEVLNGVFEGMASKKIVATCAHCFNTLANEYPELGGTFEVVHHTQLLNRLVRERLLVPVAPVAEDVTYHDPCYLGRHNKVYEAPRELIGASGVSMREMPRHGDRSMCCGAGGARMWMEERIGKRINVERVDEALGTAPTKIATGCPFCRVMLSDGVTARQSEGVASPSLEVVDVSQLLLTAVKRGQPSQPVDVVNT